MDLAVVPFQNMDLPTDILFYICEFLNIIPEVFRLHQVCKSWRHFFIHTLNQQVQHIFFPFHSNIFFDMTIAFKRFPQLKSCTICVDAKRDFHSILLFLKEMKLEKIHFIFAGCFPVQPQQIRLKFDATISFHCCDSQIISYFDATQQLATNYYFANAMEQQSIPNHIHAKVVIPVSPSFSQQVEEFYFLFLKQYRLQLDQLYLHHSALNLYTLLCFRSHSLWQSASHVLNYLECKNCFISLLRNQFFDDAESRQFLKDTFFSTCNTLGYQFSIGLLLQLASFDAWFMDDLIIYNLVDFYSHTCNPIRLFRRKLHAITFIAKHSTAPQLRIGNSLGFIESNPAHEFQPAFYLIQHASKNFQDIEMFDILVKKSEMDLEERDPLGRSIAYYAMRNESKKLLAYLADAGKMNLILDPKTDVSPVVIALEKNFTFLNYVNHTLQIPIYNFCFENGDNLLIHCIKKDDHDSNQNTILSLLRYCNFNCCNNNGENALFYVKHSSHIDLLLGSEINTQQRNTNGDTPLLYYLKNNQMDLATKFLQYYPSYIDQTDSSNTCAMELLAQLIVTHQQILHSQYDLYFEWNANTDTCLLLEILRKDWILFSKTVLNIIQFHSEENTFSIHEHCLVKLKQHANFGDLIIIKLVDWIKKQNDSQQQQQISTQIDIMTLPPRKRLWKW